MRNSSLITKSLIAVSILASCEKDPIDEIQDDYLYEMMTQEEILVEETKTVETSTQSSTIELTSTQSSTIELSDTQSSTIEITQVESTTVELTQTNSTTVEITNVATTTTVVENNNDDSSDDSNESNDSQVDNSNDNTEAPASNDSDNTPVDNTPVVNSNVASPVAVVDNTPQPIVVNATDLDYNNFDVNAQDIVIFNGVEYSSEDFKSIVDSHVANVAAQTQANEAQVNAHNNIQTQHDNAQAEAQAQAQAQAEANAAAIAAQANNDVLTEVVEVVGTASWKVNGIDILLHNSKITNQDGVHYSTTIEVLSGQDYELFALILHEGGINYHNGDTLTYEAGATATLAVKVNGVGKTKDIIL